MAINYCVGVFVGYTGTTIGDVSNWSSKKPTYITWTGNYTTYPLDSNGWLTNLTTDSRGRKYAVYPIEDTLIPMPDASSTGSIWLHNDGGNPHPSSYSDNISKTTDLYVFFSDTPASIDFNGMYGVPVFKCEAYWNDWSSVDSVYADRVYHNKIAGTCYDCDIDSVNGFKGTYTSAIGTCIVKLRNDSQAYGGTTPTGGVKIVTATGTITPTSTAYSTGVYDFYNQDWEAQAKTPVSASSPTTRVFSLHNNGSNTRTYIGYSLTATASITPTHGYYEFASNNYNYWIRLVDDTTYYSITTTSSANSTLISPAWQNNNNNNGGAISVLLGSSYTFKMHTYSEGNNYDGILITKTPQTQHQSKLTDYSDVIAYCSGNDVSSNITYTPTETGSVFLYFSQDSSTLGWNSTYNVGDLEIVTSTAAQITVTLERNGGSGGSSSFTVRPGDSASSVSISIPSKSNATFLGYYTSDGVQMVNASGKGVRVWNIVENVTLYAHWQVNGYTVTLNDNYGSGGDGSVVIANGTLAGNYPTITIPTRSGFKFLGYWDLQTGGTQYYTASGTGARTFDKTGNCTLYAHWTPNISNTYTDASVYCSSSAYAHTSTQSSQNVQIATSLPSATAGTVTPTIYSVNGSTSFSGWTLYSSDKKKLTVPSGTAAGTYTIVIRISVTGAAPSYESGYVDKTITLTVIANAITSYDNTVVSHTTPVTLPGTAGNYTMNPSVSQTAHWNNNAESTVYPSATYSYATTVTCTGFSRSGATVSVTANTGSSQRGPFKVTITGTANGLSGTKLVEFNQAVGVTYDTPVVTRYEYVWFDACGETRVADYVEYQQVKHTGSTTEYITDGGTLTFYSSGTLPSGFHKESDFSTTGRVTWDDRGEDIGGRRYAEDYLYVKVTLNGKTSSAYYCDSCYQQENELLAQHYKNTNGTKGDNITYNAPTVSIGSGIYAYGGSATVTCSVNNSISYYQRYTSLTYTALQSGTSAGTAMWRITSNGNSAFTESGTSSSLSGVGTVYNTGGTITHEDMDVNERTDTVVVTAYNVSSITKTSTSQDITINELESIALTLGSSSITMGNSTTGIVTAYYTSTAIALLSSGVTFTTDPSDIVEIT